MEDLWWVGVVALLLSLWSVWSASQQAKQAKDSAASAQRSADAAEKQLALMQEQWMKPNTTLQVVSQDRNKHSVIKFKNQGQQTIYLKEVLHEGNLVDTQKFKNFGQNVSELGIGDEAVILLASRTHFGHFAGNHQGPTDRPHKLDVLYKYRNDLWQQSFLFEVDENGQARILETTEPHQQ